METILRTTIVLVFSNFTLTTAILGLIAAAISLARKPKPLTAPIIVEELFAYYLLFAVGVAFVYNAIMHIFWGDQTAAFIGWANSPFQFEVGTASLGFGVVGLLAFRAAMGLRLAAVVGPACFLLGAAAGHLYQMITANNFAPGNAGVLFYTDILIPVIGFVFLWLQHKFARAEFGAGSRQTHGLSS